MTERIQSVPIGFLDILGVKSQGRTPATLADDVRGTIEMMALYASARMEITSATGLAVSGVNGGIAITIPEGELWAVKSVGARFFNWVAVNALPSNLISATINVRIRDGLALGVPSPIAHGEGVGQQIHFAGEQIRFGIVLDDFWWLLPGGRFEVLTDVRPNDAAGAALDYDVTLSIAVSKFLI